MAFYPENIKYLFEPIPPCPPQIPTSSNDLYVMRAECRDVNDNLVMSKMWTHALYSYRHITEGGGFAVGGPDGPQHAGVAEYQLPHGSFLVAWAYQSGVQPVEGMHILIYVNEELYARSDNYYGPNGFHAVAIASNFSKNSGV